MRLLPGMVMLMLALVISGSARATTDVMPFKDEAQEQQFRQLTEQLRCPKCQNNSIADSNAMIATDMRRRVYDLMQEGKSRQEIIDYMVARYGNFVTYDPPLTPLTVLLWVLPLAAIVAGGWIIVARTRRRVRAGMVFVNTQNVRDLRQPFGGVKASGTGREGGEYSFEVF
ncbi:aldehyde dehydrogenase family protein, partial [Salmonella enterica]|uniref:cytochrome c-type biogenesis protein n=1 Tax=Salmonella enterica TaxID=28901 RepID=UPI003F41B62F